MRIVLLGGSGQIGWELQHCLAPLGEVVAPSHAALELLDLAALRNAVREVAPDVIVNAAAYTDVDQAESQPELAHRVNALVPGFLAEEALRLGAALIHYSTDYVFDGTKGAPYREDDFPHPLNVYGQTKLDGETAVLEIGGLHLILRTSWVYSLRRPCFVTRVLNWARQRPVLRVAADQFGSPTWCRAVAQATAEVLARLKVEGGDWLRQRAGLYHVACVGTASRYEWALAIVRLDPRKEEHVAREVLPSVSAEFPAPAPRPAFSALDSSCFQQRFGISLPSWDDALQMAFAQNP